MHEFDLTTNAMAEPSFLWSREVKNGHGLVDVLLFLLVFISFDMTADAVYTGMTYIVPEKQSVTILGQFTLHWNYNGDVTAPKCGKDIQSLRRLGRSLICISIASGSSMQRCSGSCNNATRHWPISIPRKRHLADNLAAPVRGHR